MQQFSDFGNFLNHGSGIVQLMDDLGSADQSDSRVIMLGGGNPGRIDEVENYFRQLMTDLLADGNVFEDMVAKYDSPIGNPEFRGALAQLLVKKYGWPISEKNIAITNGSQSSFFVLFNLFSGKFGGQKTKKILLPLIPEYVGYADAGLGKEIFVANLPKIERLENQMFKYRVDFDQLDVSNNIGAMCVSRPTNPTGNVLTNGEIEKLRKLCERINIPLILDCAYGTPFPNIIFNDVKPYWDVNAVVCMSLSKLGLAGIRTGIVVANESIIRRISSANAILSLAPGSFGPTLMTKSLANEKIIQLSDAYIRPFYKAKALSAVATLHNKLAGLPYHIHEPEGAIFLWLWLEGLPITSQCLYQRLKTRGVYVIPGENFFPGIADSTWRHQQECIRISYATDDKTVSDGIAIIAEEVHRAYKDR